VSDFEKNIALRDAAEAVAEDAFFEARPGLDCPLNRRVFDYGFVRGWDYRQPEIILTARVAALEGAAK